MFDQVPPLASPESLVPFAVLGIFACVAAWCDYRYRTIPNWLCIVTAVTGLAMSFWIIPDNFVSHAMHMVIALIGGMILFSLRVFGGGDAKFYAAVAAWFAMGEAIQLLVAVTLSGLVLVVVWFTYRRLAGRRLSKDSTKKTDSLPYGIAIGFGGIALALM
ncbi:prepilin peptidase [Parafrankia sp. BMG5.11]|uniref:A24 family peptidase n=1 Tax=Parafrankia sp. BMG5.11 TaxID=222540 RepID=UPI001FB328D3|nr:prepilin peptidase [Parafrankia sp. BMG5.11]